MDRPDDTLLAGARPAGTAQPSEQPAPRGPAKAPKKMAIIATKGTLDMAYPPLILASTAAALGWDVQIFFTFYGLQLLRKNLDAVKISPLANPAMPMPVPMPVFVQMLPGMESVATMMMKDKIKKKGVASLEQLRELCVESDVKFIACQMTVDLFEFERSEFIDGIQYGGAATFMKFAGETDVCLFI
jgi:peroxiredoxin family protein